jgi:hypothetical protein
MLTNLKTLSKNPQIVTTFTMSNKLHVASLTRKMCEKVPALLAYCQANGKLLDRFHIPEISKEVYEQIAPTFATRKGFNTVNLTYETASQYYIRKARVVNLAAHLGVKPSFIDTTDYIWDEAYYTCYNFWANVDEVDEAWKNDNDDYREYTANKVYIEMDTRQSCTDLDMVDALYTVCRTLISSRRAMLVGKVDQCLGFISALSEFTNGFSQNCTAGHNATLRSYFNHFKEMLEDKDMVAFLETNSDISVFGDCESTHNDYVETYRQLLSKFYSIEELLGKRLSRYDIEDKYIDEICDPERFGVYDLSGAYLADIAED